MEPADLNDPALRDRAVRAALGQAPFDWLLTGGQVADMATGEMRAADIGLVGPLIASVHPPGTRGDAARHLDIAGQIVAPGLIDMHMHVESSMITPRRYAEVVVPQGTTTLCWDPHEVGNVLGLDGVRWAVEASRDLPLRVLVLAPSCVPSAPGLERAGAVFDPPEMVEMLSWPEIAGVAEVMDMRGVLERSAKMTGIVAAGLTSGKLVCGHARDLEGAALQGFAAAGIQSDHEIRDGDDLLAKLRAGFTVELRGSHPHVLPGAVTALLSLPRMPQTLTLCTDDIFPDDLVERGGIANLIRTLIGHGLPPIDALRLATLNPAQRLGRPDLGLIGAGKRADLIVMSDLAAMTVSHVFASGAHVARDGALCAELRPDSVSLPADTMHVPQFQPEDFRLLANGATARLRTVDQPRFTRWGEVEAVVENGAVVLPEDCLWMAVVHRHGLAPATPVMGVLRGWGRWRGALATTVAHDSHNLIVFGTDAASLCAAANAVAAAGGGMAVASGGAVRAVLPLPVCGLISDAPATDIAAQLRVLRAAADDVADWRPPVLAFKAVVGASLACNPGPHVTDLGIADGSTGDVFASALIQGVSPRSASR
jgi:adenine deaminase